MPAKDTGSQIQRVDIDYPGATPDQTHRYWYDSLGRLSCVTTEEGSQGACDPAAGSSPSPHLVKDYSYDELDRLEAVRVYDGGSLTERTEYEHDALDRVVRQVAEYPGTGTQTTLFSYIGLTDRVFREEATGLEPGTKHFTYDARGNRIDMTDDAVGVVRAGDAGSYAGLQARSVVGDALDLHHMPQAAAGFTSRGAGGAIAMPHAEHVLTRTYGIRGVQSLKADAGLSFRQVLARDIWDVRSIAGSSYNQGLRDLIGYYRTNFPELMARGGGL